MYITDEMTDRYCHELAKVACDGMYAVDVAKALGQNHCAITNARKKPISLSSRNLLGIIAWVGWDEAQKIFEKLVEEYPSTVEQYFNEREVRKKQNPGRKRSSLGTQQTRKVS